VYSADEGADVGSDEGTVTDPTSAVQVTGKITSVTIDQKEVKAADHHDAEQPTSSPSSRRR